MTTVARALQRFDFLRSQQRGESVRHYGATNIDLTHTEVFELAGIEQHLEIAVGKRLGVPAEKVLQGKQQQDGEQHIPDRELLFLIHCAHLRRS